MRTLIVRYSEIGIKGASARRKMEKLLIGNLLASAKRGQCGKVEVVHGEGRIFLYGDVDCLTRSSVKVFGVKSVSPAEEVEFSSLDELANKAEEMWGEKVKGKTFAVRVRRVGQHEFTSYEVADAVGSRLVKYGKVDLENPEVEVHVEVRDNKAYLYEQVIEGPGGLPLGSEGRALALFSGGIDSPVASWMVMKRGVYVDLLYCNLGSEVTKNAVLNVARKLAEWSVGYTPKFYLADCSRVTKEIMTGVDKRMWPIAFKRALYLIAERVASKGYGAIVTGESLGQVSTQTLSALKVLNKGISLPIFRPLIGFDKDEIADMARRIGTFEYSTKIPEFCSVFSFHPKVKFTYQEIEEVDKKIQNAVEEVVGSIKEVSLTEEEKPQDISGLKVEKLPEGAVLVDLTGKGERNAIKLTPRQVMEFVFRSGPDKDYVFITGGDKFNVDLVASLRKMGIRAFVLS